MRPSRKHVDLVGHDVVQQPLVVRDDQDRPVLAPQGVDAVGDDAQGVDVQAGVGLVEDAQLRLQHRHLEDLVALLLAAGEALVDRPLEQVLVDVQDLQLLLDELEEVRGVEFLPGRGACGWR